MKTLLIFLLSFVSVQVQAAPEKPATEKQEAPDVTKKEKESGGDTYNFYFQKGSGPGSVNQGGAASSTPTETSGTSEARIQDFKPRRPELEPPQFEVQISPTFTSKAGRGLALGGQYNLSENFLVQIEIASISNHNSRIKTSSINFDGSDDTTTEKDASMLSAGIGYSPMGWQGLSKAARFSVLAGGAIVNETITTKYDRIDFSGNGGFKNGTDTETRSIPMGYLGAQMTYRLGSMWALNGTVKVMSKTEYSQLGLGMSLVF